MSELGVTGDDDACKCESNGASRVCVCMRHSRETGISLLVWSVFRRMCVWTVCAVGDGVRAFSRRSVSGVFISVPTARRSRSGQPGGVLGLWPLLQERYLG